MLRIDDAIQSIKKIIFVPSLQDSKPVNGGTLGFARLRVGKGTNGSTKVTPLVVSRKQTNIVRLYVRNRVALVELEEKTENPPVAPNQTAIPSPETKPQHSRAGVQGFTESVSGSSNSSALSDSWNVYRLAS